MFVEHCGQPTHRKLAQCQHDSVDSSAVGVGCRRIFLSDVFVKPSKRQCAHENIFSHYRQIRQGIGSVSADLADKTQAHNKNNSLLSYANLYYNNYT